MYYGYNVNNINFTAIMGTNTYTTFRSQVDSGMILADLKKNILILK